MPRDGGMEGGGADTRARVLDTASDLFYREGTRAVGVDLIVARSGVAKTSLYRHFRTKDDLIEAFLAREDDEFWRQWDTVAADHRGAPEAELEAHLDWLGARVARPGYRGCPQINIAAEYSDPNHPARLVAVAHKAELRRRLTELVTAIGVARPETLALQLATLIDGALSIGAALHAHGPADFLKATARTLLAAARA